MIAPPPRRPGRRDDPQPVPDTEPLAPAGLPALAEAGSVRFTEEERESIRRLRQQGLTPNSRRALQSDLAYLVAWCTAATGENLAWPAPPHLLVKFVAHHFGDMPPDVMARIVELAPDKLLRGRLASTSVLRIISSWRAEHDRRGAANTLRDPAFTQLVRDSMRADAHRPRRKSRRSVMREEMGDILATKAGEDDPGALLRDLRDRALFLYGFSSGGRRRSEIASLTVEDLEIHKIPQSGGGTELSYRVSMGRTKTTVARDDVWVELSGIAAQAMRTWLHTSGLTKGAVFRKIDKWGKITAAALTGKGVNDIIKRRVALAGLDISDYSAHGLRSGFLTQAGRDGISLQAGMEMSLHRDPRTAMRYFNDGRIGLRKAARLLDPLGLGNGAAETSSFRDSDEDA